MTPERLQEAKVMLADYQACKGDLYLDLIAELIAEAGRLQAEVERLELENFELDLQVTWDRGSPSQIKASQAALDAAKAKKLVLEEHGNGA